MDGTGTNADLTAEVKHHETAPDQMLIPGQIGATDGVSASRRPSPSAWSWPSPPRHGRAAAADAMAGVRDSPSRVVDSRAVGAAPVPCPRGPTAAVALLGILSPAPAQGMRCRSPSRSPAQDLALRPIRSRPWGGCRERRGGRPGLDFRIAAHPWDRRRRGQSLATKPVQRPWQPRGSALGGILGRRALRRRDLPARFALHRPYPST